MSGCKNSFLLLSNLGSIIEIFSSVDQRDTVLVKPQPRAVSSSILHGARSLASLQMMRVANTIGQMGTHSVINLFHAMQDEGRLQVRYTRVAFGAGCEDDVSSSFTVIGLFQRETHFQPPCALTHLSAVRHVERRQAGHPRYRRVHESTPPPYDEDDRHCGAGCQKV